MDELLHLLRQVLDRDEPIDADTPLISSGLFDSFALVGLLVELESRYGVSIEPEDIDVSTFDTPQQILARVRKP